ncbi:hypothetical protein CVO77_08550 [Sphingopyxis lindanitolerans]|uniref:Uncharacterized protein n=1 Tax=Sphingopyxis lindanitolerans TaxID=2054227 RepID=A0A2S8B863_9SPHN|nr:hypothetical protein CVO77_08550 [Sphingopyxis lindanitolerans]
MERVDGPVGFAKRKPFSCAGIVEPVTRGHAKAGPGKAEDRLMADPDEAADFLGGIGPAKDNAFLPLRIFPRIVRKLDIIRQR